MIAGSLHFLANSWYVVYAGSFGADILIDADIPDASDLLAMFEGGWGPHLDSRILQLFFTFMSFIGGLTGLFAYRLATKDKPTN